MRLNELHYGITKTTYNFIFSKHLCHKLSKKKSDKRARSDKTPTWSEVRDCGKLIQSLKERGI